MNKGTVKAIYVHGLKGLTYFLVLHTNILLVILIISIYFCQPMQHTLTG